MVDRGHHLGGTLSWFSTGGGLVRCTTEADGGDGVVSCSRGLSKEALSAFFEYHDLPDVLQRSVEEGGK